MHHKTIKILIHWLNMFGYKPDKGKLQKLFLSHPEIETLPSITDTLNDFGIESIAAQIPFENLIDLTDPFLVFIKKEQKEQIVLITALRNDKVQIYNGIESFEISLLRFKEIFTGIIIGIEKNSESLNFSLGPYNKEIAALVIVFGFSSIFIFNNPSLAETFYFLFSLTGFIFCALLVYQELGNKADWINKFCTLSQKTDCSTVLISKASKLLKNLSLTDIGIIYFSFQLIGIVFLTTSIGLLFAISLAAALFPLYSIYQQAFVIKKWCPLCLVVVALLLLQGILAFGHLKTIQISFAEIAYLTFLLIVIAASWRLLRPLLYSQKKLENTETELLTFRRNHYLFLPYYKSQQTVSAEQLKQAPEIIIGNPDAIVKLSLVTNPLCEACQKAHENLTNIINTYPQDVCLRLIFYVPYNNGNDPRTIIASWLYDTYRNNTVNGCKLIKQWYKNPTMKEFGRLKISKTIVAEQQVHLELHNKWCVKNRMTITPLTLINEKFFPLLYRIEDLKFHITEIIELEKSERIFEGKDKYSNMVLVDNT